MYTTRYHKGFGYLFILVTTFGWAYWCNVFGQTIITCIFLYHNSVRLWRTPIISCGELHRLGCLVASMLMFVVLFLSNSVSCNYSCTVSYIIVSCNYLWFHCHYPYLIRHILPFIFAYLPAIVVRRLHLVCRYRAPLPRAGNWGNPWG